MRRLYRSRTEVMLGGVCGGLGEYFDVDPTFIRILFVFLALIGPGLPFYLLLWLIVPLAPASNGEPTPTTPSPHPAGERRLGLFFGGILIVLGIIFLLRNLLLMWWPWFDYRFWSWRFSLWPTVSRFTWPALLILLGLALLFYRRKGE